RSFRAHRRLWSVINSRRVGAVPQRLHWKGSRRGMRDRLLHVLRRRRRLRPWTDDLYCALPVCTATALQVSEGQCGRWRCP
ncbi:hypothetical protein AAVH_37092, partial [Aphelenchoides avenae]